MNSIHTINHIHDSQQLTQSNKAEEDAISAFVLSKGELHSFDTNPSTIGWFNNKLVGQSGSCRWKTDGQPLLLLYRVSREATLG